MSVTMRCQVAMFPAWLLLSGLALAQEFSTGPVITDQGPVVNVAEDALDLVQPCVTGFCSTSPMAGLIVTS